MPPAKPELNHYQGKKVTIQMNGGRTVEGVVRGFDIFLNITLDEAAEVQKNGQRMVMGVAIIRGSAVVMIEALERIDDIVRKEEKSGRGR